METAMMGCNRCDYRGDDLAAHALESGHLLCIVCQRRSLSEREPMTCAKCIARVRGDLADILTSYALLEPTSVDALTLLGDGTMQRMPRAEELAGNLHDEWPSDPLPVLAALASWEDFIRDHYGDPKGPADPTLSQVIDYLMSNLDTGNVAAQTFPAFDEFAAAVQMHRSASQHTAGLADVPLTAAVSCFDCGGKETLVRRYRPPTDDRSTGRRRLGTDREGLTEEWECRDCRSVYTQPEYYLALRAALEARRAS